MTTQVAISPEIVRLAQRRTRSLGGSLADELARNIAIEAIMELDPELGLLIDEEAAYSHNDALVSAFGVNDIVVNRARFDVRVIDEDNRVSLSRALLVDHYIFRGTFVVRLNAHVSGSVVGFISSADWRAVDQGAEDQQNIYRRADVDVNFDFGAALKHAIDIPGAHLYTGPSAPQPFDLATFVANRSELIIARQRQIVVETLCHREVWPQLEAVVAHWSKGLFRRVLSSGAAWNQRVEKLTEKLAGRFTRLNRAEIKNQVSRIGEKFGGQSEAADFRKALLVVLTREELSRTVAGAALQKAQAVAEAVLSGRAMTDAVKDVAKNRVAVDIAGIIKRGRQKVAGFAAASTEELSSAYTQMALQPVYSTHSQDPAAGVEAINEALTMMEAGEMAERIRELEAELAQL